MTYLQVELIASVCSLFSQRTNIHHQNQGRKNVCPKFREEASLSSFTEHIYCGARDESEAVNVDVMVCEKFAVSFA